MSTPTRCGFWKLVDLDGYTATYEHPLPHGVLVRVATSFGGQAIAEAVIFVPNPTLTVGPHR